MSRSYAYFYCQFLIFFFPKKAKIKSNYNLVRVFLYVCTLRIVFFLGFFPHNLAVSSFGAEFFHYYRSLMWTGINGPAGWFCGLACSIVTSHLRGYGFEFCLCCVWSLWGPNVHIVWHRHVMLTMWGHFKLIIMCGYMYVNPVLDFTVYVCVCEPCAGLYTVCMWTLY